MTAPSASATIQLTIMGGRLALPKKAIIEGDLNTEGYGELTKLPHHLTVNGHLGLRGTSIEHIPAKLRVLGNVDLEGCTSLISIKKRCVIEGNLDLEGCSRLSHIADDLYVGGDLFMRGTHLVRLPKTIIIKGQVYDFPDSAPSDDSKDTMPLRPRHKLSRHRQVQPS